MNPNYILGGCALALALGLSPIAEARQSGVTPDILAAVAASDRPQDDFERDADRKPRELMAFAGIAPGQKVADIIPGGGYFTRIFSHVVGPTGHVYAVVPSELAKGAPAIADAIKIVASDPTHPNVTAPIVPLREVATDKPVDAAWISDDYHDIYGFFGQSAAAQFDAAVFKMVKPGGEFIVIDHVAKAGTSATSPQTLHRIDPDTVIAQVTAAGFTYEGSADVLRNAEDTHERAVFDPAIRGRTDQFVMKFRKPMN